MIPVFKILINIVDNDEGMEISMHDPSSNTDKSST